MAQTSVNDDERQHLVSNVAVVVTSKLYICMSAAIYIFFPLCYIILVTLAGFLKSSIDEWSYFTNADLSLLTSLLISAGSLGIIFMIFGFCCKSFEYMQIMGAVTPLLLILQIIAVVFGCVQAADNSKYLQKSINVDMKAKFITYSSSEDVQKHFNSMQNERLTHEKVVYSQVLQMVKTKDNIIYMSYLWYLKMPMFKEYFHELILIVFISPIWAYSKECCGVYGVNDYDELKISIPISCCSVSDNMQQYCTDKKLAYPHGCATTVYQDIIKNIGILSYVTIGLIVLQIFLGVCILKMLVRTS